MNSMLPLGKKWLGLERTLETVSTAIYVPFTTQELFQPGGLYEGINARSKNLILCNRKLLPAPAGMVLGMTGYGKSFSVTDTKNPDADLCTPSRDENATVQRAEAYNAPATAAPSATSIPEPTSSQPVQESQKPANAFWNVLDFLPIVFIGAGLFWFRRKNRRGGPKG